MKWLSLDSPLIVFLGKVADLMIVNLLTILCCIPIITAGSAITAMHYVCLKIVRDEECYIVKSYFHSFKENFKQATLLWLMVLVVVGVLAGDFYLMIQHEISIPNPVRWVIIAVAVLAAMVIVMIFPVQAKFANPIKTTIKTAFTIAILQFPKTILMIVCYALPFLIGYLYFNLWPVLFLLGFSVPSFVSALLYNKMFKQLEDRFFEEHPVEQEEDDGSRIFSDAPLLPEQDDQQS